MQLSGKASACLLSVCDLVFLPQLLVTLVRNKIKLMLWEIWLFEFCINEAESKPPEIQGWSGPPPLPAWGATRTVRLTLSVGVGVGRWGGRGYRPIAGLLRAVPVSPRDGIVGGRSVLKERLAVHHLRRSNEPRSPRSTKLRPQKWSPAARISEARRKNKETTLRQKETSSLSMRQLCPRRHSNKVSNQRLVERQQ